MKAIIVSLAFLATLAYSWEGGIWLTIEISPEDYFKIWARGGQLPKIFYKEEGANLWALDKESEEDPGKILMSVYSKSDSAYLSENMFITDINAVKPGSTVATLSRNSARKLACGQSGPGIEDICSNEKLAISLKPRSVYDELAMCLIMIHDRFIDEFDANQIIIYIEDFDNLDVTFKKITKVMDIAKAAGFYKIYYAPAYDDDIYSSKIAKIIDMAKKAGYNIEKPLESNFSSYNLMKDKNFAKDIEKFLDQLLSQPAGQ
ncbi:MAG: hypothetical protein LBH25_07595 [Fibromonadaceae bacterium]|nr:hypothetical protein [Fibromonadaceae bacterium]